MLTDYLETVHETSTIIAAGALLLWTIGITFGVGLHLLGDPTALIEVAIEAPSFATLILAVIWLGLPIPITISSCLRATNKEEA